MGPDPALPARTDPGNATSQPPPPPFSLTASDGSGLSILSLTARVLLQDPVAFTEIHLVFENPGPCQIEGTFSVTLPPTAVLSRLAMQVGEGWQEGEMVEKQAARQTFEDLLHRRQDPALLERAAGNRYSVRVFPIPGRGRKEIVLSYSETLTKFAPFVLPLRGLPQVGVLEVEATVAGRATPIVAQRAVGEVPERNFLVPADRIPRSPGLRGEDFVIVRATPSVQKTADPPGSTMVLVDTSASRAADFDRELDLLAGFLDGLAAKDPALPLTVACFDQTVEIVFEGRAGEFEGGRRGHSARDLLRITQRLPLGASDLALALDLAAKTAIRKRVRRLMLITDGLATAGATAPRDLRDAAHRLSFAGVDRMDVLAVGEARDEALLRDLVAELPHAGVVLGEGTSPADLDRRLYSATRADLPIQVEGARFWWPHTVRSLAPGEEVQVVAEMPRGLPLRVSIGGEMAAVEGVKETEPILLRRLVAQAKIESLLTVEGAEGATETTRRAVVDLSIANRVASPFTSLLALETAEDYAAFHISRLAANNLLTIRDGRFELQHARLPVGAPAGSSALGASDTTGPPRGGSGSALDYLDGMPPQRVATWLPDPPSTALRGRHHYTRACTLRMGTCTVSGRLPPEAVQRAIRQNFGRFRGCYLQGLLRNRRIAGRVTTRFLLQRDGAVTDVVNVDSEIADPALVSCVAAAFAAIEFPKPEEGIVSVVYPIVFRSHPPGTVEKGPRPGWDTYGRDHSFFERRGSNPFRSDAPNDGKPPPRMDFPYVGRFDQVMTRLLYPSGPAAALTLALDWHLAEPGDVMAIIALGEVLEAQGDAATAARAYGSLIDLYANRADLRRVAGERLERLRDGVGLPLAVDTFRKAVADRPDHPSGHRLLAYALLKQGAFEEAFHAIEAGLGERYVPGRFPGVGRILREDLGLIAAAWKRAMPAQIEAIEARLDATAGTRQDGPSLRFVLNWETDLSDANLRVTAEDPKKLLSLNDGLSYGDVQSGYGPECFTVDPSIHPRHEVYRVVVDYNRRGPMGYGMGKVEVIDHDGQGGLRFDERPFVIMNDGASVDLGRVR